MKLTRQDIETFKKQTEQWVFQGSNAYTPRWVRGLCENFLETLDDLVRRLEQEAKIAVAQKNHVETLDNCVAQRDERIRELEAQLLALNPSKPKFRVGQVVYLNGIGPVQIMLAQSMNGSWSYRIQREICWYSESCMRALKPEDI